MEVVATEPDLMALAAEIRSAKAALEAAVRVHNQALADLQQAAEVIRMARDRFLASRRALVVAAGGEDDQMLWL